MDVSRLVSAAIAARQEVDSTRAALIGISGIDASGKGYIAGQIADQVRSAGYNTALINIDGWLNLPHVRFHDDDLPGNFYRNAVRFNEMFESLVLPLKRDRSIRLTADFAEETGKEFRKHNYRFEDVDIILLEGIFLFKRELADLFDLKIWIDCSFETALDRAIERSQEGLSPAETIKAYEMIYFPAQRMHFEMDDPKAVTDLTFDNN